MPHYQFTPFMIYPILMKKAFRTAILMFTLSLSTPFLGQQGENDRVYAGRNFTWGMNMGSFDLAILLREDGTFCETLDAPDWQTKIEGRHSKVKDGILLEYLDEATANDTIFIEKRITDGAESINYGGAEMAKMIIPNVVPEGYYKYNSTGSSRGMGTALANIGTPRDKGIHFYTNGSFVRDFSGDALVGGINSGGKDGKNSGTATYTLQNGVLTLIHADGKTEKSSFFHNEPDANGTFTAALNGSIYSVGEPENEENQNLDLKKEDREAKDSITTKNEVSNTNILEKIKIAHGGSALDSLSHIEAVMETAEIKFKVLIDLERKFLRLESLAPNFKYIEQLENETGWVFQNGELTELPSERILEIKNTFSSGVFLLQQKTMENIKVLRTRDNGNGYKVLKVDLEGQISGLIVDAANHRLIGTAKFNPKGNEIVYLSEFKTVSGILIPFKEELETEAQNVTIAYSTYSINPAWEASVWDRPD